MATDNIFAGTITCTGLTSTGAIIVTGAITSSVGFIGPSLTAVSAGAVAGTAGNAMVVSATNGVANALGVGGLGGSASLTAGIGATGSTTGGAGGSNLVSAGDGGNGTTTGGVGGTVTVQAGNAGTGGNANGGSVTLVPGTATGAGTPGFVSVGGPFRSPCSGITQDLPVDTLTISLPTSGFNKRVSASAGPVIDTVLTPGLIDGQTICIINTSIALNTITFDAAGTSNVADGANAVIPGLRAMFFTWSNANVLWYRQGA
jgi:hypothetical protein